MSEERESGSGLLGQIDRLKDERRRLEELNANLTAELHRLRRGQFTPEELQELCHNLTPRQLCEFQKGCENYQSALFGNRALVRPFSLWRHVKSGSLYVVLGISRCGTNAREGAESVIYISLSHQRLCDRDVGEFLDGRFEPVPAEEE